MKPNSTLPTTTTDNPLADAVSLEAACRDTGWSYPRLREFVLTHGLGIPWGGSEKHPRVRVKLGELRNAINAQRMCKERGKVTTKPKRIAQRQPGLHPDVTC